MNGAQIERDGARLDGLRRRAGLPVLLALALAAVLSSASAAAEEPALPPGVVARVHGREIEETDLLDRLVRRWGGTERGKQTLDLLIDDTCVAIEAKRRGVAVTDEEVAAYVKKVDETIRKQTGNSRSIDDVYKEQHSNPAEFARIAREYLKRQRMASEDMGTEDDRVVGPAWGYRGGAAPRPGPGGGAPDPLSHDDHSDLCRRIHPGGVGCG